MKKILVLFLLAIILIPSHYAKSAPLYFCLCDNYKKCTKVTGPDDCASSCEIRDEIYGKTCAEIQKKIKISYCVCSGADKQPTSCKQYIFVDDINNECKDPCTKVTTEPKGGCANVGKTVEPEPKSDSTDNSNLQTVKLDNPIGANFGPDTELTTILGNVVKAALGIMGGLVLLMIVWGGFTWLTGMGNPEKIKSGTNTITWAVLGAIVVVGSYFLLNIVLKALSGGL